MPYTLKDLIDQFITIERNGYAFFTSMAALEDMPERIRTMARVFAQEEMRHMKIYEHLKDRHTLHLGDEVDIGIYQKAQNMIRDFTPKMDNFRSFDRNGILEFSLAMERENLVLVQILKGLLESDATGDAALTEFLDAIAKEEEKHVSNIESLIS